MRSVDLWFTFVHLPALSRLFLRRRFHMMCELRWHLGKNPVLDSKFLLCLHPAPSVFLPPPPTNPKVILLNICGSATGNREGSLGLYCCGSSTLKRYYDKKKFTSLLLQILKVYLFDTSLAKSWASSLSKGCSLSESLGFHGLPLFTFKTDRLDFRELDQG